MLEKPNTTRDIGTFGLLAFFLMVYTSLKWEYFDLPFYWDEAWSYSKAVFQMLENGPTLNPTQVDQQVFRGHPLFFYFLTSCLATISSWSVWNMHLWMYSLSMIGVVGFYFVIKYWFDASSALIGSAILLASEMFFVQCSMLLPEVIIAFLFVFSIHFFVAKKYFWYCLFASVLVLTKESGLMLFPALGIFVIWDAIAEEKKWKEFVKHSIIYLIPFFAFCLFMLVQKLKWGWYVFPDHVAFMNFDFKYTTDKLELFFDKIFLNEGRVLISLLGVLVLVMVSWVKKYNQIWEKGQKQLISVCFMFTLCYAYFSAVNFFTERYLLSLLPIYAIVMSAVFYRIKEPYLLKSALSILMVGLGLYLYSMSSKVRLGDTSQGYMSMIRVHKSVIDDFVIPNRQASFNVGFLMSEYLMYPEMGYLDSQEHFDLVNIHGADYLITSSINPMKGALDFCKEKGDCRLVYTKEESAAWVKVYETNF